MKKLIYSLILLTVSLSFTRCESLDLAPEDFYGSTNFWNTESQVESYVLGIHQQMRGLYNMFFVLGEARGGTLRLGVSSMNTSMDLEAPIKTNTFTASSTGISNWFNIYDRLLQINHFITEVENNCEFMSDAQKGYYLGQVYGIRALYYFMLYRTYGGVPLELTVKVLDGAINANDLYLARSSAEETLNQIKSDINKSESYFGGSTSISNKNLWSPYATAMLKAQIYMWSAKVSTADHKATGNADLQVAKTALQKVIGGGFSLMKDFRSIFTNKKNSEIIFSLYFERTEATNFGSNFIYQPNDLLSMGKDKNGNPLTSDPMNLVNGGALRHEYKESFIRSFDENDQRRSGTFFEYYMGENVLGAGLWKLIGTYYAELGARSYDSDIIVYRYADALLMMAEIENSLGGDPATYINQIRERAYGNDYPVFTKGTFAENELAILKERDKEFVSEGTRWFDLVRMQDASKKSLVYAAEANYPNVYGEAPEAVLNASQAYMILWPIDVTVLNDDNLIEQNPGY